MYNHNKFLSIIISLVLSIPFFVSALITNLYQHRPWDVPTMIIMWAIHLISLHVSDVYNPNKSLNLSRLFSKSLLFGVWYFMLSLIWFFFDKTVSFGPRSKISLFILVNTTLVFVTSWLIHYVQHKYLTDKRTKSSVLLVTTSDELSTLNETLTPQNLMNRYISAILVVDNVSVDTIPRLSNFKDATFICMQDLEQTLIHNVIDETFIYLDPELDLVSHGLLRIFEETGIDIHLKLPILDAPDGLNMKRQIERYGDYYVIKYSSKFYNDTAVFIKRTIDIIGALVGLTITVLVGIILVPLIKLDSKGPAIFAQNRVGRNGRVFKFYKFRSMTVDAEERKKELLEFNESDGHMFKMTNDPRVTRVGKFIRKTSLDELPQFYNVLIGDMSLIGTRPPTEEEYRQYTHRQKKRLALKPGITGLWQVSGRSDITDFDEVVRLDVEYIENWSLKLDFIIILKTIKIVLLGKGAR